MYYFVNKRLDSYVGMYLQDQPFQPLLHLNFQVPQPYSKPKFSSTTTLFQPEAGGGGGHILPTIAEVALKIS